MSQEQTHIFEFIKQHHLMSFATIDDNGEPHPIPIYYMVSGKHMYFVSPENTKKYTYLLKRPHVYICITDEPHLETVFIKGTASLATEEEMPLTKILGALSETLHEQTNNLHQSLPLLKHHGGTKKVIKITIHSLRYRNYAGDELQEFNVTL